MTNKEICDSVLKKWKFLSEHNYIDVIDMYIDLLGQYPEFEDMEGHCAACENFDCDDCFLDESDICNTFWHKWVKDPSKENAQIIYDIIKVECEKFLCL